MDEAKVWDILYHMDYDLNAMSVVENLAEKNCYPVPETPAEYLMWFIDEHKALEDELALDSDDFDLALLIEKLGLYIQALRDAGVEPIEPYWEN